MPSIVWATLLTTISPFHPELQGIAPQNKHSVLWEPLQIHGTHVFFSCLFWVCFLLTWLLTFHSFNTHLHTQGPHLIYTGLGHLQEPQFPLLLAILFLRKKAWSSPKGPHFLSLPLISSSSSPWDLVSSFFLNDTSNFSLLATIGIQKMSPQIYLSGIRIILRNSRHRRSSENGVKFPFVREIYIYKGNLRF